MFFYNIFSFNFLLNLFFENIYFSTLQNYFSCVTISIKEKFNTLNFNSKYFCEVRVFSTIEGVLLC